jgi:hypothetical protein
VIYESPPATQPHGPEPRLPLQVKLMEREIAITKASFPPITVGVLSKLGVPNPFQPSILQQYRTSKTGIMIQRSGRTAAWMHTCPLIAEREKK